MQVHQLGYSTATFNPPVLGKDLAERLAQMSHDARPVLAWGLTGPRGVAGLTRAQASRLAEVSPYNIALVSLATTEERLALMRGDIRLRDVRENHARPRVMTDAEIETFISRADPVRILAYLDRLTAPSLSIAAE